MYWPIGAPSIYEQQLPTKLATSDDGLDTTRRARKSKGKDRHENQGRPSFANARSPAIENVDGSDATIGDEPNLADKSTRSGSNNADDGAILCLRVSRTGYTFATVTRTSLTVWQTKPTVVLASVVRSQRSLSTYGPNVSLLLRPDADILVIQTSEGYLITYSFAADLESRAYELQFTDGGRNARRRSVGESNKYGLRAKGSLLEGGGFVREASLHFRMVIKLDAGISKALALDHELVLITTTPPAVQCIRWSPDRTGSQTSTELLSNMPWLEGNKTLADIVYDRPMNIYAFVSMRGRAYAVQRLANKNKEFRSDKALFDGHIFHTPTGEDDVAVKAAINSKFSLIALGCRDGSICLFSVRDYAGGVKLLRKFGLPVSSASSGQMTTLCYSPDGYHLFAGYEHGWMTWSVYGQPGGTSFGSDPSMCAQNGDNWLTSVFDASWIGGGSDLIILGPNSNKFWMLEFARSAVTSCFTPANVSRGLLQTSSGIIVYQGDQMSDLTTIAADVSLWQNVEVPSHYLADQWPLRATVISPDSRYIAVAGQRGLAHYSVNSGRWRTFTDTTEENDFLVRGGMCWHHHILIAAVETSASTYELRLYSRELPLESSKVLHVVPLSAPAVHLAPSSNDSILVYDYENSLDHYIIVATKQTVELVKVGQIALRGIIRAPPRVRAVSWIVPDYQIQNGEASQDVSVASVFFLVDGKLVLLQPSTNEGGNLKYEMRIIAHHVEYFMLARDNLSTTSTRQTRQALASPTDESPGERQPTSDLQNSLWIFDGQDVRVWPNVTDLINSIGSELGKDIEAAISIPVDFYPLAALLPRGIIMGAEAELIQRRDNSFARYRTVARTTLFLPAILQQYLLLYDSSVALNLCLHFQHLPYFSHALEILLHNVLDEEVEQPPSEDESSHLPIVLSFLSTFPEFLEVVVQCTRKTELRSWRTLFAYLPPPSELFEASLQSGSLKTAGGYLLVLHTMAEITSTSPQVIRLLRAAQAAEDWELCKEVARFLVALDETGSTLREALELVEVGTPQRSRESSQMSITSELSNGHYDEANGLGKGLGIASQAQPLDENCTPRPSTDYFAASDG